MKLSSKKIRASLGLLLVLAVIGGLMAAPLPALAAATSVSVSPATQTIANGGTFSISLVINTDTASRGWQATIEYDPAKLTANSYTEGAFLKTWALANGDHTSDQSLGIDTDEHGAAPGKINLTFVITGTANLGGPDGSGTLCTINFTAKQNVNAVADIILSGIVVSDTSAHHISGVTSSNGSVTVGTVSQPDLVVSAASTAAVPGHPDQYTITYTITNNSAIDAGAFSVGVAINSANVPALAADFTGLAGNASTPATTTAVQTVSLSNFDSIVITADSGGDVAESSETNNTRNITFVYVPATSDSVVPVDSFIPGEYKLTAPDAISAWNLKTTPTTTGAMNIVANVDWQVTVYAQTPSDGHMIKYNGSTLEWDTTVKLHAPLAMQAVGGGVTAPAISVTANAQPLATGTPDTQMPTGGDQRTVYFTQSTTYNDKALDNDHTYHIVLIFAIANTSF